MIDPDTTLYCESRLCQNQQFVPSRGIGKSGGKTEGVWMRKNIQGASKWNFY